MYIQASEIIDRARMYAQDDFNDNVGAILRPERWLQLFRTLHRRLYKRWLMAGLITPSPDDKDFTGPTTRIGGFSDLPVGAQERIDGVVAVQGVVRGRIVGYRGAVIDLSRYFTNVPRIIVRIAVTTVDRPTFVVTDTGSPGLVRTGPSSFTLTAPNTADVLDLLNVIAGNAEVEILFAPPSDQLVGLIPSTPSYTLPAQLQGGEVLMDAMAVLPARQRHTRDRRPFMNHVDRIGLAWEATSTGSTVSVRVVPDGDDTYVVRYYKMPDPVTEKTDWVELPNGLDELFVLRLAEAAMMTEGGASKKISEAIMNAEAELGFTAASLLPPRIKGPESRNRSAWALLPNEWLWF